MKFAPESEKVIIIAGNHSLIYCIQLVFTSRLLCRPRRCARTGDMKKDKLHLFPEHPGSWGEAGGDTRKTAVSAALGARGGEACKRRCQRGGACGVKLRETSQTERAGTV